MSNDDFHAALQSANELTITFTGRKTGKKFSTPVWFVYDRGKICLVPGTGINTSWYRNVLKNPTMNLQVSGRKTTTKAVPVKDPKRVDEIVDMFRAKYGAPNVKRYYSRLDAAVELSIPESQT
jgi:deazaflavin-dependent oxidoreductase (nitroreductase family)